MTFDELKVEAEKQGYKLVKAQPNERFLPCICGCNMRSHFYKQTPTGVQRTLRCRNCGREVSGTSDTDAKRNWNKEVSK